ncbi:MAG: hypothetical protein R3C11_05485 [Planctomycetaceae bacterium]
MKTKHFTGALMLGLMILSAGSQVLVAEENDKSKQDAELFATLDANSDGLLTAEEIPAEKELFFSQLILRGDADKNGSLTKDEFVLGLSEESSTTEAAPAEVKEEAKPETTPPAEEPAAKPEAKKAKPGAENKPEAKKAKKADKGDANKKKPDGKKNKKNKRPEMKKGKPEGKGPMMGRMKPPAPEDIIKKFDKDEDGKLTGEEIPEHMKRMLKEDQSEVTVETLKVAFEEMKEKMQARMKEHKPEGKGMHRGDGFHGRHFGHHAEQGRHGRHFGHHAEHGRHGRHGWHERGAWGPRYGGHYGWGSRGRGYGRYSMGYHGRGHSGWHRSGWGGPHHQGWGPHRGAFGHHGPRGFHHAGFPHQRPEFEGGFLNTLDENDDKKLSKDELAKAVEMFAELDKNEDGQLDIPELMGRLKFKGPEMGKRDHHAMHGPRFEKGMGREKMGREKGKPRMGMKPPEMKPGMMDPAKRAEMFFGRFDKNEDGKISLEELPEGMKERFSKLDKDADGSISKEEFKPPMRKKIEEKVKKLRKG